MKKKLNLAIAGAFVAAVALPAAVSAHGAGPCDDSDGDGLPSGAEYAAHHIVFLAKEGGLGNDGHKPGAHAGFSACLPTGQD